MFKVAKSHPTWYNGAVDQEPQGKAVLVRVLLPGTGLGESKSKGLYRIDPPMVWNDPHDGDTGTMKMTNYVVVSAIVAPYSGPETFIFAADADGEVIHWGELKGSMRGTLNPEKALAKAGYKIANGVNRALAALKERK